MDIASLITIGASTVVVAGAAVAVIRSMRGVSRKVDQFRADWTGQPPRPGFKAVPGVPERLQAVEDVVETVKKIAQELQPNGGTTIRDAINRMELQQNRQAIDMGILARRLDEHLRSVAPALEELAVMQKLRNIQLGIESQEKNPDGQQ